MTNPNKDEKATDEGLSSDEEAHFTFRDPNPSFRSVLSTWDRDEAFSPRGEDVHTGVADDEYNHLDGLGRRASQRSSLLSRGKTRDDAKKSFNERMMSGALAEAMERAMSTRMSFRNSITSKASSFSSDSCGTHSAGGSSIKKALRQPKNVYQKPLDRRESIPKLISHPDEDHRILNKAVRKNFVFRHCESEDLEKLLSAFDECHFIKGEVVLKQGEEGEYFYVLRSGGIRFRVNGVDVDSTTKKGSSFGELALMYTCPRAATVITTKDSRLFRLHQNHFRELLQTNSQQSTRKKVSLLKKADFLKGVSTEDLRKLASAMQTHHFGPKHVLVTPATASTQFWILQSGKVELAIQSENGVETESETRELSAGMYWGEKALAKGEPLSCNVIAIREGTAFSIEFDRFKKVMGSMAGLIHRTTDAATLSNKVQFVREAGLSEKQLKSLSHLMVSRGFPKGFPILELGISTRPAIYVVRRGSVQVTTSTGTKPIFSQGSYFGEENMRAEDAKSSTRIPSFIGATALEECDCGVLSLKDCQNVFDTDIVSAMRPAPDPATPTEMTTPDSNSWNKGTPRTSRSPKESPKNSPKVSRKKDISTVTSPKSSRKALSPSAVPKISSPRKLKKGLSNKKVNAEEGSKTPTASNKPKFKPHEQALSPVGANTPKTGAKKVVGIDLVGAPTIDAPPPPPRPPVTISPPPPSQYPSDRGSQPLQRLISRKSSSRPGLTMILPNSPKDYTRHCILGEGTFGQVWLSTVKGTPMATATPIVLKIQSKSELIEEGQVEAVVEEQKILKELDHPFIVQQYRTYQDESFLYSALEFLQGGELFSLMNSEMDFKVKLPEDQSRFYALGIAGAIAHMHDRDIVFRDLKPENVMIDKLGYPVLIDFGFAKKVVGKSYTLCGTPGYLAPEIILSVGHDCSADHWSLGILIYEMLMAENPFYFEGMDQMLLFQSIVDEEYEEPSGTSEDAGSLIAGLLVKDPTVRLGSLNRGESDILEHPWFGGMDVQAMRRRTLPGPWIPKITNPLDNSHFDDWNEVEDKTEVPQPKIADKYINAFVGFGLY